MDFSRYAAKVHEYFMVVLTLAFCVSAFTDWQPAAVFAAAMLLERMLNALEVMYHDHVRANALF